MTSPPIDATNVGELRARLALEPDAGAQELLELADRYATNRQLVYDAVLLKRDISSAQGGVSPALVARAGALLDAIVTDSARSGETRHEALERARSRALEVPVPRDIVFTCSKLTKTYRRGVFSLRDVSLELRYGRIIGVVGRNGSGKTTLFRLVVGELRQTSGTLDFPALQPKGGKVNWRSIRQQLAYVPQELPRWFDSLRMNLHYEAALHGILGKENDREVDFIIERLDLGDQLEKRWQELSGGYKLRFALARALVWRPKLLVLDEPLANLDIDTQQVVLKDLRHLTDSIRDPLGVIVSSQHLHEIQEVSNDILFLSDGSIAYYDSVDNIGATRDRNTFEVGGRVELEALRRALDGPEYQSIFHNGVSFVVVTDLGVSGEALLQRLFAAKVDIDYFRNVSKSVKSLFDDTARKR